MKHLRIYTSLLALFFTGLIQSCVKSDLEEDSTSGEAIEVSSIVKNVSTYNKTSAVLPDNFSVFAYYTGFDDFATYIASNTPNANWMYDQLVVKNASDVYEYSPLRYWPFDETTNISFFAYSPGTSPYLSVVSPDASTKDGLPEFDYSLDLANHSEDVLFSEPLLDKNKTSGDMQFLLKHGLSKINFRFRDNLGITKIKSITLKNVYSKARFSIWDDAWTNHNTIVDLQTHSIALADQDLTNSFKNLSEEYFVIPSTLDALNPPVFTIVYEVAGSEYTGEFSPNTDWLKGNNYTYEITINVGEIDVNVDVEEWIDNSVDQDINGQHYLNLSTRQLYFSEERTIFYTTNFPGGVRLSDNAEYFDGTPFSLSSIYSIDSSTTGEITFGAGTSNDFKCFLECLNLNGDVVLIVEIEVYPS
jgi:hypothetical protein